MARYKIVNESGRTKAFPDVDGNSKDVLHGETVTKDLAVEFTDQFIEDQKAKGCFITKVSGGEKAPEVMGADTSAADAAQAEADENAKKEAAAAVEAKKAADKARKAEEARLEKEAKVEGERKERADLETEGNRLELVFTDKTSNAKLSELIAAKKAKLGQ